MGKNGAQLLIEALKKEGVEVIFGYPGGAVIPAFDELYKQDDIRVILTRHEQAAVHAADGYSRSTGKLGVCLVTSGPGATNTITGLATANFDSVPLLCISGQVPRAMIGNDAFQEADTVGLTRPVTKHNYLITTRNELGLRLKQAFFIARTGRPGPVVVDIPKDIFTTEDETEYPETVSIRGYNPTVEGNSRQVKKAADRINEAKKPLFFIGGGLPIAGASPVFSRIIAKTGIPVVTSLMGIGSFPQQAELNLGMIGMHGSYAANHAITECDLIIGIGVRFDDRATGNLAGFAPNAEIIHIDIDPTAIARNVEVAIPIVGDARATLEEMEPQLEKADCPAWIEQVSGWKRKHPLYIKKEKAAIQPEEVIRRLSEVFPDAIVATEVGQNQMWAAHHFNFTRPRTFLTSGGLGTMGYGFPAAVGAKVGNPDKIVIDIAGDGSIQMNIQELATVFQENIPVIILVLNNGYLGMVRQWQEMFQDRRYSSTCLTAQPQCAKGCSNPSDQCPTYNPDFVKLAEAYGACGIRVSKREDLDAALSRAKKEVARRTVLIDCHIEREANVWPMVAPGANLDDVITGEAE